MLITKSAMQVMNREGPEVFQSKCLTHQLPNRKTRKTSIFTLLEEMVTKHAIKLVAKTTLFRDLNHSLSNDPGKNHILLIQSELDSVGSTVHYEMMKLCTGSV